MEYLRNITIMNILIIGNVCIDKNTTEKSSYQSAGSPAMFTSRIFRQLPNTSLTIVSNYGKDFLKYLNGISIYPSLYKFNRTLLCHNIHLGEGKRIQKVSLRENTPPVKLDSKLIRIIRLADVIFFAPLVPNIPASYIRQILSKANKESLKILSASGYFRNFDQEDKIIFREFKEAYEIVPYFDFVIFSEKEYPNIEKISASWVKDNKSVIIITKAERGAKFLKRNGKMDVPTKPVAEKDIVDSTGSGDIFSACFAYKYFKCKDIVESIKFAHKVAGYCLGFTPDEINLDVHKIT